MLLLERRSTPPPDVEVPPALICVFGVGLVGSSIVRALRATGVYRATVLPLDWEDRDLQRAQLGELRRRIAARDAGPPPARLALLWSAGRAGFRGDRDELEAEHESFRAVLSLAEELAAGPDPEPVDFHLISSLGGLFEGQRLVDRDSRPRPLRPYGEAKLRQEEALARATGLSVRRIHRLSSAYGPAPARQRRGLIPTLIADAAAHRVTRIHGHASTLRDYLWIGDVGRHCAMRLLAAPATDGVDHLASGKPSSVLEIIQMVEAALGAPVYRQFDPDPDNPRDISVRPSLLPPDWRVSSLPGVLRRLCQQPWAHSHGS